MTEREKMVKAVKQIEMMRVMRNTHEECADYLIRFLASELNLPPCKVGDTVWLVDDVWHLDDKDKWEYHYEKEVVPYEIRSILISCNSKNVWTKKFRMCEVKDGKIIDHQRNLEFDSIGKTVFLTREEAEKH